MAKISALGIAEARSDYAGVAENSNGEVDTMTEKKISRQTKWRRNKQAQGLCLQCGKPAKCDGGVFRARCMDCTEKRRLREKIVREKQQQAVLTTQKEVS